MEKDDIIQLHRHDGRRLIAESATLFAHPYYQQFLAPFNDLVKATKDRANYKDPKRHLGMQISLLDSLKSLEQTASTGKKQARTDTKAAAELVEQSKRNNYLSKAIKEIADGIAWRTFGYDRFTMRILSQAQSPGHTWNKDGQATELKYAKIAASNGAFMLLNDLTNCVRVGDITMAPKGIGDVPYLTELKKGKDPITVTTILEKLDTKQAVTKQQLRMFQAQAAITFRKFPVGKDDLDVTDVVVPLHDVISGAGAIAKQAINKGAAARMLTPYMRVEAMDIPKLMQLDYQTVMDSLMRAEGTIIAEHTTYDHLITSANGETERASPPYTIFPWPAEVITRVITGEVIIRCDILLEPLQEAFKAFGWELIIDRDALERYEPSTEQQAIADVTSALLFPPGSYEEMAELMWLRNSSGFRLSAFEFVVSMAREYLTVQHVVAVANAFFLQATRGQAATVYHNIKDGRRWS